MKVHPINAVFYFSLPLLLGAQIWVVVAYAIGHLSALSASGIFLAITYLVPVLIFRLLQYLLPANVDWGEFDLGHPNRWFCGICLQIYYLAMPHWEEVLRWIPGAYSAWLSLWGSKIGRDVHWSPCCEVLDRDLLMLGDNIQVGHRTTLTGHYIDRQPDGRAFLFRKVLRIGSDSLIGGFSVLGPGLNVEAGSFIKIHSILMKYGHE